MYPIKGIERRDRKTGRIKKFLVSHKGNWKILGIKDLEEKVEAYDTILKYPIKGIESELYSKLKILPNIDVSHKGNWK